MKKLYENCYTCSLDNGLQLIVEKRPKRPLSLGVWVRVGSRQDPVNKSGMAHFIEHLLFKGTKNRSSFQISATIDSLGGSINGLTHKEYTLLYVNVLSEHLEKALDVLSDLVINPLFKPQDLEKEKGVVLEEIKSKEDDPQDRIFDLCTKTIWPDSHSLSCQVIGDKMCVLGLTREDILSHFELYNSQNMVIVAVGDISLSELQEVASEKFKGVQKPKRNESIQYTPPVAKPSFQVEEKETLQTHLCLGFEGISMANKRRFTLEALNVIFGSGMSSRLFRKVREELGLAYCISSHTMYYTDTGLISIYSSTKEKKAEEVIKVILEEARSLTKKTVDAPTLRTAKEKIKGNFLLGMEGSFPRMMRLGISAMYRRKLIPVEAVIEKIEKIKAQELKEIAAKVFKKPALVLIGPKKDNLASLKSFIEAEQNG